MASISALTSPYIHSFHGAPISKTVNSCPILASPPFCKARLRAMKTSSDDGGAILNGGADLLRKPGGEDEEDDGDEEEEEEEGSGKKGGDGDTWVDWENRILEETVPLVGFVRMILHSGKYGSGDRLSPEHEKTILEKLLAYHPECEKKIGCGVDYLTIGYHPIFQDSRCLFIVRKDGESVDFSYWKCIKGLIRKNYPLYAESFIVRHFRKRGGRN